MDKQRGSGSTFSTPGKEWHPFKSEAAKARKMARLHRLKRAGLAPAGDKQSLRAAAEQAAKHHTIKRV
jgi:hypothetical protein